MIAWKDGYPILPTQVWRPVEIIFPSETPCAAHDWHIGAPPPWPLSRREDRCACGSTRWVDTYFDEVKHRYRSIEV